jgi:hypothetical protein
LPLWRLGVQQVRDQAGTCFNRADRQPHELCVFRFGKIVSSVPIVQVILCLVQRRDRDSKIPGEFFWVVSTEALGDISRRRTARIANLIAIAAIS